GRGRGLAHGGARRRPVRRVPQRGGHRRDRVDHRGGGPGGDGVPACRRRRGGLGMSWVWLLAAIASELVAALSLRASVGVRKEVWRARIAVGYLVSCALLAAALSAGMPGGGAYGIWVAVGIGLVALLARAIWKAPLTPRMMAGIAIIAVGVI